MTEVSIIWFLYDRNLCHEEINILTVFKVNSDNMKTKSLWCLYCSEATSQRCSAGRLLCKIKKKTSAMDVFLVKLQVQATKKGLHKKCFK